MHWGGHADVEIRLVSPLPMGPPVLLLPAGAHPLNGVHVASSGCGQYKNKYVCTYVCVCVCVCACTRVCCCVVLWAEAAWDLQPTGLAFEIVQIHLWIIQHANNQSVFQCNVSPVMGFVRHRYNTEPVTEETWHWSIEGFMGALHWWAPIGWNSHICKLVAVNLDCNIGCLQFSLYHALVTTVPALMALCIVLQRQTLHLYYTLYYAIVETVVRCSFVCGGVCAHMYVCACVCVRVCVCGVHVRCVCFCVFVCAFVWMWVWV